MNILVKVSIILGITLILLILPIIISNLRTFNFDYKVAKSRAIIENFGYNNKVSAPVRTGKTSFVRGVTSMLEISIIEKLEAYLKEIKQLFYYLDFDLINNYLVDILSKEESNNILFDNLAKELKEAFEIYDYFVYDYFNSVTTDTLIADYIECFWQLYFRGNYVISKTRMYSPITNTMAFKFETNQIEIYNRIKSKDYNLKRYSIIVHDEASDDRGAKNFRETEDSGAKEFFSKIGHIGKETIRYFTIKQRSADEIKQERALADCNIRLMKKVVQVNKNNGLLFLMSFMYDTSIFFNKLFRIHLKYFFLSIKNIFKKDFMTKEEFKEEKYNYVNKIRINDYKKLYLKYWLSSQRYNVYRIRTYEDEENIKSDNENHFEENVLVIPAKYCFAYPKFEFDNIQTDLIGVSTKDLEIHNYFVQNSFFEKSTPNNMTKESEVDELDF